MPHGEAREHSMNVIRERADLLDRVKKKIPGENAARFYKI